jgi:hypothetical protein
MPEEFELTEFTEDDLLCFEAARMERYRACFGNLLDNCHIHLSSLDNGMYLVCQSESADHLLKEVVDLRWQAWLITGASSLVLTTNSDIIYNCSTFPALVLCNRNNSDFEENIDPDSGRFNKLGKSTSLKTKPMTQTTMEKGASRSAQKSQGRSTLNKGEQTAKTVNAPLLISLTSRTEAIGVPVEVVVEAMNADGMSAFMTEEGTYWTTQVHWEIFMRSLVNLLQKTPMIEQSQTNGAEPAMSAVDNVEKTPPARRGRSRSNTATATKPRAAKTVEPPETKTTSSTRLSSFLKSNKDERTIGNFLQAQRPWDEEKRVEVLQKLAALPPVPEDNEQFAEAERYMDKILSVIKVRKGLRLHKRSKLIETAKSMLPADSSILESSD